MRYFLSGGSKSGKSMLGQRLARDMAAGGPLYYIATMIPRDEEDQARIRRHLQERAGWGFTTVECGTSLLGGLQGCDPAGSFLLDSVTAKTPRRSWRGTLRRSAPAAGSSSSSRTIFIPMPGALTPGRRAIVRAWV